MKFQRCTRCVMDNSSDTTITFDKNGNCNYCTYALERMPNVYFPTQDGKIKLDLILSKIKSSGKNKKYDCIMGISGGLDSSYLLYLGYKWGLKILAIHIDDGFNSSIAIQNVKSLCERCKVNLIIERPDEEQFQDVTRSFIIAGLPGICNLQDNLIETYLYKNAKKYNIKYFLSGSNFAHESILERGDGINASDGFHIKEVSKIFGSKGIDKLPLMTLFQKYVLLKYTQRIKVIKPLDYIDYNKEKAIKELHDFSNFNYYGGKHYESILTHFVQTYYLPQKFNIDKRKSHLSSLIVSGQITREEALSELEKPLYDKDLMDDEINFILNKLNLSSYEFDKIMKSPPKRHSDYPMSHWNKFEKIARKFRKFLND